MRLALKVVDMLAKNTERGFTINEVAKGTAEHYSFVHRVVNQLASDGVIIKTKVGNSYLCSLNVKNENTLVLIALNEIEKTKGFYKANKNPKLILDDFTKTVGSQFKNVLSIVLFGSYAKGTATKASDMDILLIRGKGNIKIEKVTREIYAKYGKEISPVVISQQDFREQRNVAIIREIIENHYVLYGAENFVNLVFENAS